MPQIRHTEQEIDVMIIDDSTIIEKLYIDENEIICWHYGHAKGKMIRASAL